MPKTREITPKQKKFADKYLETGNATHAALAAYNTKDKDVAASMGCENLRKQKVIEYFANSSELVANNMVALALSADSESVQFQASKDVLDRAGFKPVDKNESVIVNVNVNDDYLNSLAKQINGAIKGTIESGNGINDPSMDAKVSDQE